MISAMKRTAMWRAALCTVIAGVALSACGDPVGPKHDLRDALQRWSRSGPSSYSIKVRRLCECPSFNPVLVTVRDGVVQSRRFVHDSSDAGLGSTLYPSVAELFAMIDTNLRGGALRVQVTYDPTFGYPTRTYIDRYHYADDEVLYEVSDFRTP